MATWVRTGTGTAPSATDTDLTGQVALDTATAPADFDPNAVTNVNIAWRLTIVGLGDDSWTDTRLAVLRTSGAVELATVDLANATRTASGNYDSSGDDATPTSGRSTAEWEGATVEHFNLASPWAIYNQTKGKDGSTASIPVANVVVTITYTPAASPGVLNQAGWRLRNDDGTETTATWKAANNTTVSPTLDTNLRIRFAVENTDATNPSPSTAWSLWYSKNAGAFTQVTNASTNARLFDSTQFATNDATTDQAVGGAGSFEAGYMVEATGTPGNDGLAVSSHTEVEFNVQLRSADLVATDTVKFRIYKNGAPLSGAYTQDGLTLTVPSPPVIEATDYRWYADGTLAGSTPLAALNKNAVANQDTAIHLRVLIKNTGTATETPFRPKLQERHLIKGDGGAVEWTAFADVNGASARINSVASTPTDNATTAQRIGVGTNQAGYFDEGDGTFGSAIALVGGQEAEYVWSIEMDSADLVTEREAFEFRVVNQSDSSLLDAHPINPSLNPTMAWAHGFEGGTNDADVNTTVADPDTLDALQNGAGLITYDTGIAWEGSTSAHTVASALSRIRFWDLNQAKTGYLRFYIRYTTLPGVAHRIADNTDNSDLYTPWALEVDASNRLRIRDDTGVIQTATGSLSAATWYRIEVEWLPESGVAAGDGSVQMRYYDADAGDTTLIQQIGGAAQVSAQFWEDLDLGLSSAVSVDFRMDSIALSNVDWIGPTSTTEALTGVLFAKAPTFNVGSVVASQPLAGSLFTKAPTFGTGTVTAGAVAVTGSTYLRAPNFGTGTITVGSRPITGTTFSSAPSFGLGTVAAGSVAITGSTFSSAPSFPPGTVDASSHLTGILFARAGTFPTGQVGAGYLISGVLYAVAPSFPTGAVSLAAAPQALTGNLFTPTVTFGTGTVASSYPITGSTFVSASVFNAGIVAAGAVELTGSLFVSTATFPPGTVQAGSYPITGSTFVSAPVFGTGTIGLTAYPITGTLFVRAATFPTGDIVASGAPQALVGSLFTVAPTFTPGTVQPGSYALTGALFVSAATFGTGTVRSAFPTIGTTFVSTPSFGTGQVIVGPVAVVGTTFTKAPTFAGGAVSQGAPTQQLNGSTFASSPSFGAGAVTAGAYNLTGVLFTRAATFNVGAVAAGAVAIVGTSFVTGATYNAGAVGSSYPLTGVTFVAAPSFGAGAVAASYPITGSTFTAAPTFPTGAITAGAGTIVGITLAASPSFPTGTVATGSVAVTGSTFTAAPTFPPGTIVGLSPPTPLTGATFVSAATFGAGAVTTANQLDGVTYNATTSFPQGAVTAGSVDLTGSTVFTVTPTFPVGSIEATYQLDGATFTTGASYGVGAVTVGPVAITGAAYVTAATFGTGTVRQYGLQFWQYDPVPFTRTPTDFTFRKATDAL